MTARDKLTRFMRAYRPCAPKPDLDFEHLVDTLLAEHAHELAENVRAKADALDRYDSRDDTTFRVRVDAMHDAADLIDPAVTGTGDFAVGDIVTVTGPMSGTAKVTAVGVNSLLVIDQLTRTERSVFKSNCRRAE